MRVRTVVLVVSIVGASLSVAPAISRAATQPVVTLNDDSADFDAFQYVNDQTQKSVENSANNFLTFASHEAPAKSSGLEGTATAFVSQASSLETPGQPPFPISPLNDIGMAGTSTSDATATGNGPAVPNSFADGSFDADVLTTQPVTVFFSGALLTTNTSSDSCSSITVDLNGASTFGRHFAAYTGGDCAHSGPHHTAWAQTFTLPVGETELDVEYSTAVDDALPGAPKSVSSLAKVTTNLSFFPPTAAFSHTLSGSTAHFNGTHSAASNHGTIATWHWSFGDGTTATTTTPTVTHTYPASPKHAPTYVVGLSVVDGGGSVSPTITHSITGTAASEFVSKKTSTLTASGAVTPSRHGRKVVVTLARRQHGKFRVQAMHRVTLSGHSHFTTSYPRPSGGMCRLTARYPGDKTHLASEVVKTVAC